jgi:hypothetical protein
MSLRAAAAALGPSARRVGAATAPLASDVRLFSSKKRTIVSRQLAAYKMCIRRTLPSSKLASSSPQTDTRSEKNCSESTE